MFWITDLKAEFGTPASRTVATEFVGTAVTSEGPPYQRFLEMLPEMPACAVQWKVRWKVRCAAERPLVRRRSCSMRKIKVGLLAALLAGLSAVVRIDDVGIGR